MPISIRSRVHIRQRKEETDNHGLFVDDLVAYEASRMVWVHSVKTLDIRRIYMTVSKLVIVVPTLNDKHVSDVKATGYGLTFRTALLMTRSGITVGSEVQVKSGGTVTQDEREESFIRGEKRWRSYAAFDHSMRRMYTVAAARFFVGGIF